MEKLVLKCIGFYINATTIFTKYNQELQFKLLCKVKKPPLKPATKAFFEKGTTILLPTSRGTNVALHHWGTGDKKLLFLHGWTSNSKQWQPYVEQLDLQEYTIYALDAPAHGASEGNHLNVELYRETIQSAVYHIGEVDCAICHSLGSLSTSYQYLLNSKTPIGAYVIMGTPTGIDAILQYSKEMLFLSKKALKNLRNKIDTVLKIPFEEVTLQRFFEKVDVPCLVIHEESDSVTPLAPIKDAIKHLPHIGRKYIQGQNHMLKGQETIDSIKEFLKYKTVNNYVL
ncbi:alpha/beta hydrolase [Dokdonia pacifica]|uniref:Serine aminopeptidase, S33 n=1 Tax=Dokdonia pacifica TaxID=1627892 RepID=A0A238WIV2_9FLAO|nr:alpha/beta hydrolase [Dokdonia pacifica]GGG21547.1 alpha/beta hydrolase [Dokdonia pacifica]SNR46485.1 Serine aminopeptidase, S33 [Dokdonia pacifica]